MESPMDMEDDGLPRKWPTTTSENMDSSEQIASLGRPPGFITSRLPTTPPRSRSSSTSTPPPQPRKSRTRYQKQAECPAEAVLQALMANTHISDASPKRRNQPQGPVKSLFFVPNSQLLLPNRSRTRGQSEVKRPPLSTFGHGHSDSRIRTVEHRAREFGRSHSISHVPQVQDFDSDFSSNCAAAAAASGDRITTKYELGRGGGRGTKRTRSKSNQENAEPGPGSEGFEGALSGGHYQRPIKKVRMNVVDDLSSSALC
ncbi:hypothetical protein PQX77_000832 [Marasmius sp. AFHP31]|nr:hypothetical protein PQX77_000832 [Marasmius sp. AFHP31]